MEEERRQREEHARRESEALDAVRERYAKTTKVSIGGILVSPENIHFHPEVD